MLFSFVLVFCFYFFVNIHLTKNKPIKELINIAPYCRTLLLVANNNIDTITKNIIIGNTVSFFMYTHLQPSTLYVMVVYCLFLYQIYCVKNVIVCAIFSHFFFFCYHIFLLNINTNIICWFFVRYNKNNIFIFLAFSFPWTITVYLYSRHLLYKCYVYIVNNTHLYY